VAEQWGEFVLSVIEILGIPVNAVSESAIRQSIEDALQKRSSKCLHVVTLNPEYIMAARRDPDFAYAIRRAGLVTADGIGVKLAARLNQTGNLALDRMTGVDLLNYLAAESVMLDAPLFLLGAEPGVAEDAAEALKSAHPGARIAGWWSGGSPKPVDDAAALERIRMSGAKTLAVAYGGRGQTTWIERNLDALTAADVRVAVGVGGALDFVSGRVPRAPRLMQKLGIEWLYRLVKEPWRWRRQLVLPVFAVLVIKARIADFFGR
jgi:N-acetylglucosaminyldiphosphoundecaprenol N-acetyl-beta-D-mannosaminyltransferase